MTLELGDTAEPAALLLAEHGRVRTSTDFVSVRSTAAPGIIWGDSRNGAGWRLYVDLADIPRDVTTVRLVGWLPENGGTFGQLEGLSARVDDSSGTPQATFEMADLRAETSVIVLELYRRQDAWKVRAVGQGYTGGRPAMLTDHGIDPGSVPAAKPIAVRPPTAKPTAPAAGQPAVRYEGSDQVAPPQTSVPGTPIQYQRADQTAPAETTPPKRRSQPEQTTSQPSTTQPVQPAPRITGPLPLWDLVEQRTSTQQPVRPVQWETQGAEFTWCEMIRNLLPDSDALPPGVDKFTLTEHWAQQLRPVRGAGFEYTWRDPQDRRLNPTWITLKSALIEPTTGRIVAAGHLTHENFGTSPAYDLGAITGSNGMSWPEQGHTDGLFYPTECLYIGSTRTGVLAPVDSSSNLGSVDLDPASGTVAVLESLGSSGCISVYDGETGARRRLAFIDQISGNEQLRFSLDGQWLLMPRYDGAHLCEVSTGRILRLPVNTCCWWPLADSTLLEVAEVDGRRVPRLFSLDANAFVHNFPAVTFDAEDSPGVDYVAQPSVSPDGTELLALTPTGVSPAHRDEHGVGGHLARITLADGRGRLVRPATLNMPFPTERDVSEARWTGPYPRRAVNLAPALEQQLRPPIRGHEYLAPGRYSAEAEEVMVKALNTAIALVKQDEDVAHLMPEVIMSLITVSEDPDVWQRQREWLLGLGSTVADMVADGRLTGRNASAWLNYASAAGSIATTGESVVGPTEAVWIST